MVLEGQEAHLTAAPAAMEKPFLPFQVSVEGMLILANGQAYAQPR